MQTIADLLVIAIASVFVYNFVLARFLGLCPFVGVTKKTSNAIGMGIALTFVMTMSAFVTYLLYVFFLHYGPQNVLAKLWPSIFEYQDAAGQTRTDAMVLERVLRTGSYILVIAALVQLVELMLKKVGPVLYHALGIYLPLITTNCAVFGVALLNTEAWRDPANGLPVHLAAFNGFCGGLGFMLAMLLMSSIRERLAEYRVPKSLQGLPIAFISAGLMALAFMGFTKLFGITG